MRQQVLAMIEKMWRVVFCLCIATTWALSQIACGEEPRDFDDNGGDSDSDTDECLPVIWGSGFTLGNPVANWSQSGYMDSDLDGTVEQEEVSFTLEDIHCLGVQSIVLVMGDTL